MSTSHLLLSAGVTVMTPGRGTAILAGVVGLLGVAAGGSALRGSAGRDGTVPRRAFAAPVLGLIAAVLGGIVVATADGGVGTGNGLAGGVVAMVLGLIAVALGGTALVRARRTAQSSTP